MSEIKLLAVDMDGTLLDDEKKKPKEFIPWVVSHPEVRVVIASGRQYETLRRDFLELSDRLYFLADNGALVFYKGETVYEDVIADRAYADVMRLAEELKEEAVPIVCGKNSAYMKHATSVAEKNADMYYKKLAFVDDLYDCPKRDAIVKVAFFFEKGNVDEMIARFWGLDQDIVAVRSGDCWVDVMNRGVNKGSGIEAIREKYGIAKEESMAFGDYLNDCELLKAVEESYAMENAHPELKALAKHIAPSNNDNGVMKVIKQVIG